jgi:hypothetical protein
MAPPEAPRACAWAAPRLGEDACAWTESRPEAREVMSAKGPWPYASEADDCARLEGDSKGDMSPRGVPKGLVPGVGGSLPVTAM